jgi:hypothetical protein
MAITRNFKAEVIPEFVNNTYALIVTGEANSGKPDVMPELAAAYPPGIVPNILILDLKNAVNDVEENFKEVRYEEQLENDHHKYEYVDIRTEEGIIEHIKVDHPRSAEYK